MLQSLALSARAYLDPVGAVPRAVAERRWLVPLLWLSLTCAASGAAFAVKLDASKAVLPKLAEKGELAKASEREVAEEIEQAQRVALVAGVAKGVFVMPFAVLWLAILIKFVAWLLGRKAPFAQAFTAAAIAMLPIALAYLLSALVALKLDTTIPAQDGKLLESSFAAFVEGPLKGAKTFLKLADFFQLWSTLLFGIGFGAATGMPLKKSLVLGLFLYVLLAAAAVIGLPAMATQGGPGGPK